MALFIISNGEISPELLALFGPSAQVAEGRPYEIAMQLFRIAGGARARAETWRMFALEPPDSKSVPILAEAVRAGLEGEESFSLEVEISAVTAQAVAEAAGALLRFLAVYRLDPDKTGEVLVPQPR